ncbi:hypothetical protein HDU96_003245 [Phlyctochytrium bullatum]|nr:hypothetical protein HDU96_003245 [Phlyctochytrium bullatum]
MGERIAAVSAAPGGGNSDRLPHEDLGMAWGFGGSVCQLEGAWDKDGKGASIYDKYYHDRNITVNGDVATDHYNRIDTDLAYLGRLNATAYRFSVSWPRILPNCTGTTNPAGLAFYHRMIDPIRRNGAEPFLTMFHWDLPQACMKQFGGFGDPRIVDAFDEYGKVLVDEFGGEVRYWLTMNEPEKNCILGYEKGIFAPGLVLGPQVGRINYMKYSYLIHAKIVQYARSKYPDSDFKFGIPTVTDWIQPATSSAADKTSAEFVLEKNIGQLFDPVVFGDWGDAAKLDPDYGAYVRAAPFTSDEQTLLRNTVDFIALNYYSSSGVAADPSIPNGYRDAPPPLTDGLVSAMSWQRTYAAGLRKLIVRLHERYGLEVHVTECGFARKDEDKMAVARAVEDGDRKRFWKGHLGEVRKAVVEDGVRVGSVLAWATMDNFEWGSSLGRSMWISGTA